MAVEGQPADPRRVSLYERHDVVLVRPDVFDVVLFKEPRGAAAADLAAATDAAEHNSGQ